MIVVVMGVAGCGKTLIGTKLAKRLGAPFVDGDDYHSPENVQKMQRGVPLTDEDRQQWLELLSKKLAIHNDRQTSLVLACSALKRSYRQMLTRQCPSVTFVLLTVPMEVARDRILKRTGHFFPEALLQSQFDTLEVPREDEVAMEVDGTLDPKTIVSLIVSMDRNKKLLAGKFTKAA